MAQFDFKYVSVRILLQEQEKKRYSSMCRNFIRNIYNCLIIYLVLKGIVGCSFLFFFFNFYVCFLFNTLLLRSVFFYWTSCLGQFYVFACHWFVIRLFYKRLKSILVNLFLFSFFLFLLINSYGRSLRKWNLYCCGCELWYLIHSILKEQMYVPCRNCF